MIRSMLQVLFFASLSASIRVNRAHARSRETSTDLGTAGSFAGDGCFSVISQLGYLNGVLAGQRQQDGLSKLLFEAAGTSSGGTWALGMIFGAAAVTENKTDLRTKLFGRNCHFWDHPVSEWSRILPACAGCAMISGSPACSPEMQEEIFGVMRTCILRGEGKNAMTDARAAITELTAIPYSRDKFYEIYKTRWVNPKTLLRLDVPPQLTLQEAGLYGLPYGLKRWGVFRTKIEGPYLPTIVSQMSPGINSDPNLTVLDAMSTSGDAVTALGTTGLLQTSLKDSCAFSTFFISQQTAEGKLPYPFDVTSAKATSAFLQVLKSPRIVTVEKEARNLLPFLSNMSHRQRQKSLSNLLQLEATNMQFSNSVDKPWFSDGIALDNNAVGATVNRMDSLPEETRPPILISLITGAFPLGVNDTATVGQVLNYFRPKVPYWYLGTNLNAPQDMLWGECGLKDLEVNNPNHFFEYVTESDGCTADFMLSETAQSTSKCQNLRYQASKTGLMYVAKAKAMPNSYWGIKGGWAVTLYLNINNKNEASKAWIAVTYGSSDSEMENFPANAAGPGGGMGGMNAKQAFALLHYNTFRGFMTSCAIHRIFRNEICKYCLEYPAMCLKYSEAFTEGEAKA